MLSPWKVLIGLDMQFARGKRSNISLMSVVLRPWKLFFFNLHELKQSTYENNLRPSEFLNNLEDDSGQCLISLQMSVKANYSQG